jgi:hypothetical protein
MFVWLRVQGFESSVYKDFLKENDVLILTKKLKFIHLHLRSVSVALNIPVSHLQLSLIF